MTSSETAARAKLHVALITRGYPSLAEPHQAPFVEVLARGLADQGAVVSVVAPRGLGRGSARRDPDVDRADRGRGLTVATTRHLSFSRRSLPGGISTFGLTLRSFTRAAGRVVRRLPERPSVLYGHFLYPSGYAAARLGNRLGIPAVVALGESSLEGYEADLGRAHVRETLGSLSAILSVSEENEAYCVERLGIAPERVTVIPNAVDLDTFRPMGRAAMREKHGLPVDEPIVAFLGHFIDRKGPLRVLEALSKVPGARGVFLGEGEQVPRGPEVLHAGRVPHAEVPEWLSAADVFVLPTRAEGSPNAVLEAMACGLPVVASSIPAVREVVDPAQGLLVGPDDVESMARAIGRLLEDDVLRTTMAESALARARGNSIARRAERIRDWLETTISAAGDVPSPPA